MKTWKYAKYLWIAFELLKYFSTDIHKKFKIQKEFVGSCVNFRSFRFLKFCN